MFRARVLTRSLLLPASPAGGDGFGKPAAEPRVDRDDCQENSTMRATPPKPVTAFFATIVALLSATAALANLIIHDPADARTGLTRHALVIGVDSYDNLPDLGRAVADAEGMAAVLEQAEFAVTLLTDPSSGEVGQALDALVNLIRPGEPVLVHAAGHGLAVDGRTLLLLRDAPSPDETGWPPELFALALPIEDLSGRFHRTGAGPVVLIADICRNNPLALPARPQTRMHRPGPAKSGTPLQGPAPSRPGPRMLVYPVEAGGCPFEMLSNDDSEAHSVFMRHLLPYIAAPGLSLQQALPITRNLVLEAAAEAGLHQRVVVEDSLSAPFVITVPSR